MDSECTPDDVLWAISAGVAPASALYDNRLAAGYLGESVLPTASASATAATGVTSSAGDAAAGTGAEEAASPATTGTGTGTPSSAASAAFNFQRKFTSAVAAAGALEGGGGAASASSALSALVRAFDVPRDLFTKQSPDETHAMVAALRSRRHPALTHVDSYGRKCQPLIVLAALLDKATNLGGLARTSEIFAAEALIVPDLRVRADQQFKDVSVSASEWMTMYECKPEQILRYIREQRALGYTIVGLEQAARSKRLGDVAFPEKICLVLGAELRGMPAEVIQELDIVIEIPQLGLIRSLNVHVSASLCIWEYTRQRLSR